MHYRNIPYLNTLPKYLFTGHSVTTVSAGVRISPRRKNLLCFCPFLYILIKFSNYYTIFLHNIKSKQYPPSIILSAGVLFIRRRKNYRRGWGCKRKNQFKKIFRNSLTVPKTVAQCRKRVSQCLFTLG